jgi:hypothetical protein
MLAVFAPLSDLSALYTSLYECLSLFLWAQIQGSVVFPLTRFFYYIADNDGISILDNYKSFFLYSLPPISLCSLYSHTLTPFKIITFFYLIFLQKKIILILN